MKKLLFRILLLPVTLTVLLISGGCDKKDAPSDAGNIEFVSLTVERDTLAIMELTKVVATVHGDDLSYSWKCDNELGIFEGSGAEVLFTICHGGRFKITCEVKNSAGNKATKDVYVSFTE